MERLRLHHLLKSYCCCRRSRRGWSGWWTTLRRWRDISHNGIRYLDRICCRLNWIPCTLNLSSYAFVFRSSSSGYRSSASGWRLRIDVLFIEHNQVTVVQRKHSSGFYCYATQKQDRRGMNFSFFVRKKNLMTIRNELLRYIGCQSQWQLILIICRDTGWPLGPRTMLEPVSLG